MSGFHDPAAITNAADPFPRTLPAALAARTVDLHTGERCGGSMVVHG